ncbi:hypothetical protein [Fulvivirga ligni]|uniref:hypothetical protein n=1 Tax=Fulvivirga ligni TaxID=2904246 RepID=UPI001F229D99|nr:hypothetical protein [Fulvivirga ligni]UII24274.1 hypothetical protein LVD16_13715 [Fulvivirga ligni]
MKATHFHLLIILTATLMSCDMGKKTYSRYEIVNNSGYTVVLRSFSRESSGEEKTIIIHPSHSWESEKFTSSEPEGGLIYPDYFLEGDSIRVEFNNEKVLTFIGTYSERNILYEENYELIIKDDQNTLRQFILSDLDYEAAEVIGG